MPKIVHFRDDCIGCFSCIQCAEDNWEVAEDGKVNLKRSQKKNKTCVAEIAELEVENNQLAAQACPMGIIRLLDDQGNEV